MGCSFCERVMNGLLGKGSGEVRHKGCMLFMEREERTFEEAF